MRIILSPAKKMNVDTDTLEPIGLPAFIDKSTEILAWLRSKSKEELKALWECNDKIAEQNCKRLETMDLYKQLTPAVLAYEGIAYRYMVLFVNLPAPDFFFFEQIKRRYRIN